MKYAIVYGLISGSLIVLTMIASFELTGPDSFVRTEWYGYLLMLVVLSFIFVGVKRYRDVECGGVVRFGRAFLVGLGMSAFAGLAYVAIFEIYLAATDYDFLEREIAAAAARAEAAGELAAAVARRTADLEAMIYNPMMRIPLVFLEIFPVGLVVSLLSAALLKDPKFLAAERAQRR